MPELETAGPLTGFRLMDGNEAAAWGALYAGCGFFAGYPITPATGILNAMLSILPSQGKTVLQTEDEIAAIGTCIGASMAGLKAMTATSGPGVSLYSEHVSFAVGSEIPLVIIDVQRLGPSTGSATKGADGDVQFMRWGNSGGQPVIVLCPTDVRDCLLLTVQAFNLAETYRCPVFLASNKEIGLTKESLDLSGLDWPPVRQRKMATGKGEFLPFHTEPGQDVPAFAPLGDQSRLVRQTSSTHGEDGYITASRQEIAAQQERRRRKVESHVQDMAFTEYFGDRQAETVIVTYGVSARSAVAAWRRLAGQGVSLGVLVLKTLWPVLEDRIGEVCEPAQRIVVAELNQGQYAREIQRILPDKQVRCLGRMDGELIAPQQIEEVVHG